MFFSKKQHLEIPADARIILIAGGSGMLGRILAVRKPADSFIVNVSRKSSLEGSEIINCNFDLLKDPEIAFQHLASVIPFVDVFVYAAYSRHFNSFDSINKSVFLEEYELNVHGAVVYSRLCAKYFWSHQGRALNIERARKAIFISSGAAFGKSNRPELASYAATKAALNALGPYGHDYLYTEYGVSLNILAPGSLTDPAIAEKTAQTFWSLQRTPLDHFTLDKAF